MFPLRKNKRGEGWGAGAVCKQESYIEALTLCHVARISVQNLHFHLKKFLEQF